MLREGGREGGEIEQGLSVWFRLVLLLGRERGDRAGRGGGEIEQGLSARRLRLVQKDEWR